MATVGVYSLLAKKAQCRKKKKRKASFSEHACNVDDFSGLVTKSTLFSCGINACHLLYYLRYI